MPESGRGLDARRETGARIAVVAILAALTGVLALASAPALSAASIPLETSNPRVAGAEIVAAPAAVERSWSEVEMREAVPPPAAKNPEAAFDIPEPGASSSTAGGDFLPGDVTAYPARVHGKIFFRSGANDYVCSGTVVDSRGRNVVLTAGHCVYDHDAGAYASQMIFVPAYDGTAVNDTPLGTWAASAVFTTATFVSDRNRLSHDIGAVVLADPIEDRIGARGIAFDLDPGARSFQIFGYPAKPNPPFDGSKLIGCDVETLGRDASVGAPSAIAAGPCSMGPGSSGGGWVTEGGYVNSVVSYGYCSSNPNLCGTTYGPYFTSQALSLYTYPAVGGSVAPTVSFASVPPAKVRGRSVKFRLAGTGSTPIGFRCRLDRRAFVACGPGVRITRLSPGKHVLKVQARDQTGRNSRVLSRSFRVVG